MLTEYKMSYVAKDHLQLEGEQVTSLIKLQKSTSVFCFLNSMHKLKSYNASAHFHLEGVQVPSNYRKSHSVFQNKHTWADELQMNWSYIRQQKILLGPFGLKIATTYLVYAAVWAQNAQALLHLEGVQVTCNNRKSHFVFRFECSNMSKWAVNAKAYFDLEAMRLKLYSATQNFIVFFP